MRKVLWLVSITLPQAAAACGVSLIDAGGGWLSGQLDALHKEVNLTVCNIDTRVSALTTGTADGVQYALLPNTEGFAALLEQVKPELVHIWGTEYAAAAAMQQAAKEAGLPVLVGIQGVMRDCAAHLCDGVPKNYLGSCAMQRLIDRHVPGALLDKLQHQFDTLSESEANVLRRARYVTGRTGFDRRAVEELAPPDGLYFTCNETLRPAFYTGTLWHPREFGAAPVLFLSQGNYPLKNLHTVLQAMPRILTYYPNAVLKIAGWPPLERGALLRPIIDWMFPYQRYCKKLIRQLHLEGHVQYTGLLQAAEMRQAFLDADLYLLPSTCENSPNSLGEAMLLGMPCVASCAGGIPDMLTHGEEGLLYGEPCDAGALANAVCEVLSLPDGGRAMGQAARTRALRTHDPRRNAETMQQIYETILTGGGGR